MAIFAEGDKHKELSFTTNTFEAGTEVINGSAMRYFDFNHNLNKFPSATTVDSAGSQVVGDIQHIDLNSFKITFKAAFQGKVYAN